MIPLLLIKGQSNTGKTTLISRILKELSAQDMTIAVLKHSTAEITGEPDGKDTFIYRENGAIATAVAGNNLTSVIYHNHRIDSPVETARLLFENHLFDSDPMTACSKGGSPAPASTGGFKGDSPAPAKIDLILGEGYKGLNYPSIALIKDIDDEDEIQAIKGAVAWIINDTESTDTDLTDKSKSMHNGNDVENAVAADSDNQQKFKGKPLFCLTNTEAISRFIHQWWQKQISIEEIPATITLSDNETLEINSFTAITLNKMIRGLLSQMRGYSDYHQFTLKCVDSKLTVTAIDRSGKESPVAVIPFIEKMICRTVRAFLSTLKYTDGKISSFTVTIDPAV